ncbi:MAG TPA: SIR2 family protein [Verrucomicrobiae bacterium]|nr:SIR2 family protein [Verrucomicrobiae bacterium]
MKNGARIAFLLGAGASIPAQMPKTSEITECVLSGSGFTRCSGLYVRMQTQSAFQSIPDERVALVGGFAQILRSKIAKNYGQWRKRAVNYEDIYYVASQLRDDSLGEYENPVVVSFGREIGPLVEALFFRVRGNIDHVWNVDQLAMETAGYIEDVVRESLSRNPSNLESLSVLVEACSDDEFNKVDFFTLNHDRVLEACLAAHDNQGITFTDGFESGPDANKVRRWNPALFDDDGFRVRLFKLHGSVDWFTFHRNVGDSMVEFCGRPVVPADSEASEESNGGRAEGAPRPLVLIGTFNKMLRYMSGVFADLHSRFYRELFSTRCLVISGYSLGDKGINERILEWILGDPQRKMVLVCPDITSLKEVARDSLRKIWDPLKKEGRLIEVEQGIEAVKWSEIKRRFTE